MTCISDCIGRNRALAAAITLATAFVSLQLAQAQNLVQNPSFADGGGSFIGYSTNATSLGYFNGNYAANLSAGDYLTQTIATTPDATYIISFMATFEGSGPADYNVSFGSGSLDYTNATGCCNQLAPFSFSATATGATTDLTFTNAQSPPESITALDVEAAPAPLPGAGAPSLFAALLALTVAGLRRVRGARTG
jgi:hypothetical protein